MGGLKWALCAPGVWHAAIGTPEKLTPLGVVGASPKLDALRAMGEASFPFEGDCIATERVSGKTVARLPLEADEEIFGLGLQFLRMNHRGRTRYLRVNSDPVQDTGETHAPVPFYVSSRGYGVLADTARIATIHCGSCPRKDAKHPPKLRDRARDDDWQSTMLGDEVEVVVPAGGVDLYVFAGPLMLDVVRRYNLFSGGGVIPPRWGLGFWHRVHYQYNAEQTLAEAREFRKRGYPCDVIGLEPGWHSKSYPCTYEWGADRFPDPRGFVETMSAVGFRVNLWEHPYVSPEARIHPKLEKLSGSHTVWGGLAPDYTLAEAREILKRQHDEEHVSIGVSGYKLDECDGSELTGSSWMFPAHATFPSGHDGEQLRQVYGLLFQKMTAELFRKRDRRTYGLVRASNAGASALPYVLYSDLYDHRQYVRALCNSSFSGLLWTPEIRGAESAEEWVRRMQVVCFSPMAMLNAWGMSVQPWSFPDVAKIVLDIMQLRMRLMPYFYSAFARYWSDGTPPFRAMALEPGMARTRPQGASSSADLTVHAYGLSQTTDIDDQYMAGDSILVAPLFAGETSRQVVLPEGDWHDFETGERFEGGRKITVTCGVEKLPLFVREGGIIPMMPALEHAPAAGEAVPLEVRHYGAANGSFRLFDDDGETFAYERGQYCWRTIEVVVSSDGKRRASISAAREGWRSSYGEITWRFMGE